MKPTQSYDYTVITALSPELTAELDQFLLGFDAFTYFQSPAFFRVCWATQRMEPIYVLARYEGRLVGALLACTQTYLPGAGFWGKRTVLMGEPIVCPNHPSALSGLLQRCRPASMGSFYTQIRTHTDLAMNSGDFWGNGFAYEDHLNILVDLTPSEEALWKGVHTKRRNEIKRAMKEGCTVHLTNSAADLAACYTILEEVYQRARLPLPNIAHFQTLLQQADETSGLRLFTARWNGRIIGCMLCLAQGRTLYDYYAGAHAAFYDKHPNDLLPWEVMRWGKANGFACFDFGGAGKPNVPYGVRDYKKKFGGELVCYGRYECHRYPQLYQLAARLLRLKQQMGSLTRR